MGLVFSRARPRLGVLNHYGSTTGPGIPPSTREEVLARVRSQYSGDVVARKDLMTIEVGDSVAVAPGGSMPDRASDRRQNSGSIAFGTASEPLFRETWPIPRAANGCVPFLAAGNGLGLPCETTGTAVLGRITTASRIVLACMATVLSRHSIGSG